MRAPTAVPFRVAASRQRPGASGGSGGLAPGHAKGKLQPNGSVCGLSIPDLSLPDCQITIPASWVTNTRARFRY